MNWIPFILNKNERCSNEWENHKTHEVKMGGDYLEAINVTSKFNLTLEIPEHSDQMSYFVLHQRLSHCLLIECPDKKQNVHLELLPLLLLQIFCFVGVQQCQMYYVWSKISGIEINTTIPCQSKIFLLQILSIHRFTCVSSYVNNDISYTETKTLIRMLVHK